MAPLVRCCGSIKKPRLHIYIYRKIIWSRYDASLGVIALLILVVLRPFCRGAWVACLLGDINNLGIFLLLKLCPSDFHRLSISAKSPLMFCFTIIHQSWCDQLIYIF
jgi:hypothetical protein